MVGAFVEALGVEGASQLQQLQIPLGVISHLLGGQVKPLLASSLGSQLGCLPIQAPSVSWCKLELQEPTGIAESKI